MDTYTNFLFARPSFFEGMPRVLDIGGTLNEYNTSLSAEQTDSLAISADWRAIGSDLFEAFEEID